MIAEQTWDKMRRMRLNHLAVVARDMAQNPAHDSLPFADQLGILIDAEWEYRQSHKTELLRKKAALSDPAAKIEAIDWLPERGLDKKRVLSLATCGYIDAGHDVVILGKTGVGKSFLAQALGDAACRKHRHTRYIRMPALLDDLAIAFRAGRGRETLDEQAKPDLLIIDDFMLCPPGRDGAQLLLEIAEKRLFSGSTIYCSQIPPDQWHQRVEEKIVADALLDRIVNRGVIIQIGGDSMRKRTRPAQ
ncbi:MAG: ATP-binding protein [Bifidobacteriaceae bacterium]|nr:ATP-binding protein [Bifidobacteriaceae bacterium]